MKYIVPTLTVLCLVLAAGSAQSEAAPEDLRDALMLSEGEVVRGQLDKYEGEDFYFDSDDLDNLVIGLGDVTAFDFPQAQTFRFGGRKVYVGPARMQDGQVTIQTSSGPVTMPIADLVGIMPGTGSELDWWTFSAALSVGGQSGNTDQLDLTARANIKRETVLTRLKLDYLGNYSTFDSDTSANNHRASEYFDIFVTDRFFVTVPFFEYFTDEFQNIAMRLTPGVGLGYEIYDRGMVFWDVTAGAAYQYTEFDDVVAGQDDTSSDAAVVLSTDINFDLPRGVEWDNRYKVAVVVTDTDQTSHHALSVLSFDIWGPMDLELTFQWDRIQNPEVIPGEGRPEKDDYRYTVGFGLDF